jgi:carbon monoxide dehydrogenase subunit G
MKLENEFRVPVPVDDAWQLLLDLERIAPCMPGAQLQEVEGDEYRGIVKVKVGPITAQYKGAARMSEVDEAARRVVITAAGRDTRGQGNASATVTVNLQPDADGTHATVDSDVTITGKVAQFGRGVIADVSNKLLAQFVACLERDLLPGAVEQVPSGPAPSGPAPSGPVPSGPRKINAPEAEAVDLLRTAGAPVLKRVVPAVVLLVAVILVVVLLLR